MRPLTRRRAFRQAGICSAPHRLVSLSGAPVRGLKPSQAAPRHRQGADMLSGGRGNGIRRRGATAGAPGVNAEDVPDRECPAAAARGRSSHPGLLLGQIEHRLGRGDFPRSARRYSTGSCFAAVMGCLCANGSMGGEHHGEQDRRRRPHQPDRTMRRSRAPEPLESKVGRRARDKRGKAVDDLRTPEVAFDGMASAP